MNDTIIISSIKSNIKGVSVLYNCSRCTLYRYIIICPKYYTSLKYLHSHVWLKHLNFASPCVYNTYEITVWFYHIRRETFILQMYISCNKVYESVPKMFWYISTTIKKKAQSCHTFSLILFFFYYFFFITRTK